MDMRLISAAAFIFGLNAWQAIPAIAAPALDDRNYADRNQGIRFAQVRKTTSIEDLMRELHEIPNDAPDALSKIDAIDAKVPRGSFFQNQVKDFLWEISRKRNQVAEAQGGARVMALLKQLNDLGDNLDESHISSINAILSEASEFHLNNNQMKEVQDAAKSRLALIYAPRLTRVAEYIEGVPESFEGLKLASAALKPYDTSIPDTAKILDPARRKVKEMQSSPAVINEFLAELEAASLRPDGLSEIDLLEEVMIPAYPSARQLELRDTIQNARIGARDAHEKERAQARFSSIIIKDLSSSSAPGEPTAEDIAKFAHQRSEGANFVIERFGEVCRNSMDNIVIASLCLNNLSTYVEGMNVTGRVTSATKLGCDIETQDSTYLCSYQLGLAFELGGQELPKDSIYAVLIDIMSKADTHRARFTRRPGNIWQVNW